MIRVTYLLCLLLIGTSAVRAQTAPVLSNLEAANLIYNEGDPATPLTNTIQLASQNPITRVAVQIADGYVAGQDRLVFADTEEIRGVYDEATGTLLLLSYPAGSSGSAVSFQNALRTVTYQNTNLTDPQAGLRTLSFRAFDEQNQESPLLTRNLSVLSEDNAPELTLPDDAPISYPAPGSGQPVSVFNGLTVVDPDGSSIVSAEVTIGEGFRLDEDQLALPDDPGDNITVTVDDNRQTITLNGPDSPEAYQRALQGVQFINSTASVAPTDGNRKITATVSDENTQSLGVSRFVAVGNTNVPPTISSVLKATTTGADLSFTQADFADQYRDPENAPFTGIFIRSLPQRGTLFFQGSEVNNSSINRGLLVGPDEFSDLVYQPASDFTGEDRFRWNASDGGNFAANNAAVIITVTAPEPAIEVIVPEAATVQEDRELLLPPVEITVNQNVPVTATLAVSNGVLSLPAEAVSLVSFASGDGAADLSMVFTGSPSAVAYAMSGLRYLPDENYNGPDALSVSVSVASNATDQGSLAITVVPSDDPFRLTNLESEPLTYVENDPPVSLTDQIAVEDLDSESTLRIAAATITIAEGYVAGEDVLEFAPLLNITGTQQDNVLTLTGVNDISTYQTALRAVTYQNTSDAPAPTKTVTFTLRDEADSTSNTLARGIVIQAVEDSVRIENLEASPLNYVVENDFSRISTQVTLSDPDTRLIDRVVVSVSEGYDRALDSLYLEGFDDINAQWNDTQGVLTLTGENTLETYTRALRSVRYRNNSTVRDEVSRTLSIQAFNGDQASEVASRDIELIANDPPVVSDFTLDVMADISYVFTPDRFAENYQDPDNEPAGEQPAEIRITALPQNGVLIYRSDTLRQSQLDSTPGGYAIPFPDLDAALLSYVPTAGFVGADAIGWNAFDGAETAEADASIRINVLESLTISLAQDTVLVCPGQSDTLAVTLVSNQTDVTYNWTCDGDCGFTGPTDQATVAITPTQATQYVISVSSAASGLQAQDTITVTLDDCPAVAPDIPSGFTPDADGVNDQWVISNAPLPLTVEIFDRYGHSVYRSEEYQNDWEGTYEGALLPVGTYYYLVTDPNGETYKGAISILR